MGVQRHEALAEDEPAENAFASSSLNQGALPSESAKSNPCVNTESSEVNESGDVSYKKSNTSHIYRQDVVKNNTSGMIGIVTEVAGDSDSDSDSSITDDENDSEDEDGDGEEGDDSNNASRNSESNVSAGHCKTDALLADQLRVLWMDESESTQNFSDVEVVDRGFLHGDFVAAASDPTGQVGVVVDVNICADLLSHDGSIIKDVSSKNIRRIRDFTVGDYVVLGPWLGRVDDVLDNVTVLFDDGSVCKVSKADPLNLKPISKNILEDGHFPYYPGQRVRASSSSVFKNSRWLSGLWKANRLEGTVTKVTVGSVFVYWIASAGYGPYSSTAPAEEQSPKNLKLLSCFSHANWQLGDWCLLPSSVLSSSASMDKGISKLELNDSANNELDSNQTGSGCDSEEATVEEINENKDTMDLDPADTLEGNDGHEKSNPSRDSSSCCSSISVSKEPVHEAWPLHRKKIRKVVIRKEKRARKKEESFEKALLIANTRTKVDVAWQDGTIGHELNSTSLIPIDNPGDHEFVSEQYVVEKTSDDGEDISEARRVGVVRSVNAKERTACVRWLKNVARAEDPREFDSEEIVSVYELEGHPDYDYCYGDVVVRLTPVSAHLETASVGESTEKSEQKTEECGIKKEAKIQTDTNRVENASSDTSVQFSDLSWVGNITGLKNGDIEVTWADGMVSTVGPQAIYVVGRDDDDESIAAGSETSDAASWETVNDDEMEVLEDSREDIERENSSSVTSETEESGENDFGRAAALSVPLAAFRFVTRLASGIFSRGPKNLDSTDMQIKAGHEHSSPLVDDESSSQRLIPIDGDTSGNKNGRYKEVVSEATENLEACEALYGLKNDALESCDNGSCSLKHFDITQDPSDHYFIGANGQSSNRKWLKKVQQDWNILQNNLPEEIYVRVYEDRMDLLRAVIVGPYGTPYQDGLFFFDFHLPPEYPDVPPSAYYHSGGWRINPNLYEEGKVCLSLLNTWTGRGNEVWDPKSSSILQVLVSLQGLVLNSKPYFNEAGYDKQIGTAEGEKNSLSYNENTFLLNCKTMMYLMRKPPKDFEVLKSVTLFFLFFLLLETLCSEGCLKEEREALLGLNSRFDLLSSSVSEDCCEWYGVECNSSTGRVTRLEFFLWNSIQQYINYSDFSVFKHLKNLYLSYGNIVGCVGGEGLSNLELLDISGTNLNTAASIVSCFDGLSSLKSLSLDDNGFNASSFRVFETLSSKLPNLEVLRISDNYLTNHILPSLEGFTSLKRLYLRETGLDSDVHMEALCSKLRNIELLDLSENNFNHTDIGSALSGLSSLKSLYLGSSALTWRSILNISKLSSLETLQLEENNLNESQSILRGIKDQDGFKWPTNLQELWLSENRLTDEFLPFLSGLPLLKFLDLNYNQLKGVLDITENDGFKWPSNLQELWLSQNSLSDQFLSSLSGLSRLQYLHLSESLLQGFKSPTNSNNMSNNILSSLSGLPRLQSLDLSYNQLEGAINISGLSTLSSLTNLDLSYNNIHYFVIDQGSNSLSRLDVLDLDGNMIYGNKLRESLRALSSSIRILFMSYNNFKGTILAEDFHDLKNLEDLRLDKNNNMKNDFFGSIGNLTSLKVLSLTNCEINDTLPAADWSKLKKLEELNLIQNGFEGFLPKSFINMTSLRKLELSQNHFRGKSDSNIVTLTSLEYFDFTENQFEVPVSFTPFANHSNLKVVYGKGNKVKLDSQHNFQTWIPKFQL